MTPEELQVGAVVTPVKGKHKDEGWTYEVTSFNHLSVRLKPLRLAHSSNERPVSLPRESLLGRYERVR